MVNGINKYSYIATTETPCCQSWTSLNFGHSSCRATTPRRLPRGRYLQPSFETQLQPGCKEIFLNYYKYTLGNDSDTHKFLLRQPFFSSLSKRVMSLTLSGNSRKSSDSTFACSFSSRLNVTAALASMLTASDRVLRMGFISEMREYN